MACVSLQGLNAALFYNNKDTRSYVSLVPTSAHTGDGMGDLISQIVTLTQGRMANKLAFSQDLDCMVLEVHSLYFLNRTITIIVSKTVIILLLNLAKLTENVFIIICVTVIFVSPDIFDSCPYLSLHRYYLLCSFWLARSSSSPILVFLPSILPIPTHPLLPTCSSRPLPPSSLSFPFRPRFLVLSVQIIKK